MGMVSSTLNRASDLYVRLFAEWLHIHFLIRTVLILFALFLLIFLAAQLFQYIVGPAALMFFYHAIFRAWNYLFVETPHEWIYINHHSKDSPKFSALYLRLCDRVKQNRIILSHTKYKGMIIRSQKFAKKAMVVCGIAATLWVSAFGLHQEYAAPVLLVVDGDSTNMENIYNGEPSQAYSADTILTNDQYDSTPHVPAYEATNMLTPADLQNATLSLNEQGSQGARLRDGAGISGQTIIEILWDDAELVFLNSYVPDEYVNGLYWLHVQSPTGMVGYISSQLVEVE
jgi:hypothetical protein